MNNDKKGMALFCVCYDNRPKDWYNDAADNYFPCDNENVLSFVTRGYADPDEVLFMTFRVYEGYNDRDYDFGGLPVVFESHDNAVHTNASGFYYSQISTDFRLDRPAKLGGYQPYTAVVEVDGEVEFMHRFMVVNVPSNAARLVEPVDLRHEVLTQRGRPRLHIDIDVRSLVPYAYPLLVGAYLPVLKDGRELFDRPNVSIPPSDFALLSFKKGDNETHTIELEFDIEADTFEYYDDRYLVLTVAGRTFFKLPLLQAMVYGRAIADDLSTYLIDKPHHDVAGADALMPDDFAELLRYMDKRRVFDAERRADASAWQHRHLVLTGKRGTGKRTAAHKLGDQLVLAGVCHDVYELDAIEMLDPTNGFSPNCESTLEQHDHDFVIINDAEALALKGSVGTLNGIEVLANKLRKLPQITVALLGKKGRMEEIVNLSESARDLFYTFYHFDDVAPDRMLRLTEQQLADRHFRMTEEAYHLLGRYLERAYSLRGSNFGNMYFARRTVEDEVLPRLVRRTVTDDMAIDGDVNLITAADIPQAEDRDPKVPMQKLEQLIGLDNVKKSIINHTALVRLNKIRSDRGLYNRMPPMHMVFTGNPGTGKTTIAEYLGEIYRGIGALSSGHLVQTDRSKLVGQYIGDTEKNTLAAIQRASGGVLFIDEAYNLFVKADDSKDFGMRVIETLLTYLSMEDTDMIVILAGYTNEMKRMLESNPGLKSRFPYIFHFDDYSPEQLLGIGKLVLTREQYRLTPEAEQALSQYIIEEYNQKDEHFGNGRFITRLLKSHIIPSLSQRLSLLPPADLTDDVLSTIEVEDIPTHDATSKLLPVDETIITSTLQQLDRLVGVAQAKKALHDYVTTTRLERTAARRTAPKPQGQSPTLYWNFIGNTGTGKSTVAELLGKLMQGLGMLKRGHCVTLNIEELTSGDMYQTMEKALKRAEDGLLFMDMDSPRYRHQNTDNIRLWIVNKIRDTKQQTAVVFAEAGESSDDVLKSMANNGIAAQCHSVLFPDFTPDELLQLLRQVLMADHGLELADDAQDAARQHIGRLHATSSRNNPVNARTIQLLAQTLAQTARLRMAASADEPQRVELADVDSPDLIAPSHTARIGF